MPTRFTIGDYDLVCDYVDKPGGTVKDPPEAIPIEVPSNKKYFSKYLAVRKDVPKYVVKKIMVREETKTELLAETTHLQKIAELGCRSNLLCYSSYYFETINSIQYMFLSTDAFMNGQSINNFLNQQKDIIPVHYLLQIFYELMEGLDYIHNVIDIAHNDLKPENILINDNYRIQIIDFGLSCSPSTNQCQVLGTVYYSAPELLNLYINPQLRAERVNFNATKLADVFSMGIVLYMLANNSVPFNIVKVKNEDRQITAEKILTQYTTVGVLPSNYEHEYVYYGDSSDWDKIDSFNENLDKAINQYIRKVLRVNSSERPDSRECLERLIQIIDYYNTNSYSDQPKIDITTLITKKQNLVDLKEAATDRYDFIDFLGQGGFGKAFMAVRKNSPHYFIKRYPANLESQTAILNYELENLIKIKNYSGGCQRNLECIFQNFGDSNGFQYVVTQAPEKYQSVITFRNLIKRVIAGDIMLSNEIVLYIMQQSIEALQHMYTIDVAYLNINPDNILINLDTYIITFINFDILFHNDKNYLYYSPEILEFSIKFGREQISLGMDNRDVVWRSQLFSLGVVFYELISGGQFPWGNLDPLSLYNAYKSTTLGDFSPSAIFISDEIIRNTLEHMLTLNPEDRPLPESKPIENVLMEVENKGMKGSFSLETLAELPEKLGESGYEPPGLGVDFSRPLSSSSSPMTSVTPT